MLTQWPALACAPLYRCPSESTSENVLYQGCSLSGCLQTDTRPSALLPSTQTQLLGSIPAPAIWRRNKGPSPHSPPGCQEETGESWHSLSPSEARRMEEAARSSSSSRQLLLSGCWGQWNPLFIPQTCIELLHMSSPGPDQCLRTWWVKTQLLGCRSSDSGEGDGHVHR